MNLQDTFDQFLDRDCISEPTRQKYFYRLRGFVATHADKQASDITTPMILDFINSKDLVDPSRALLRACFHAFFAFCGTKDKNPAKSLPRWRDTPRRIILPRETAVKLAFDESVRMCNSENGIEVRDGLIFTLAVMSGNRRGEIRNVRVDELLDSLENPEENGVYRVFTSGKTGECILRFTSFHVPYIHRYLFMRPLSSSKYLFVNMDKRQEQYGEQLSIVTFNRVRLKVCKRADVDIITYQELRRRLATAIARAGNVDTAAHALNHSPHSGDRVIRLFYYDPDKNQADTAVIDVFNGIGK